MSEDLSPRLVLSHALGAYLAVNALPDSLIVMDGKDCVVQKASQLQGNHDWQSTLVSSDGAHRVLTTHAMPEEVWKGREDDVERVLDYAIARPDVRVIFLGASRMASITEPAYDMIVARCAERSGTRKPLIVLPTRSLLNDWLQGYADALAGLARALPLEQRSPTAGRRVGIVGYLMDRNEEDHFSNLRELARLLEGIGAEVLCTWLDGGDSTHLSSIGRADLIVSLPHAREAARVIAQRTGAKVLETGLPMGLEATSFWLHSIAAALGTSEHAETFVDRELANAVPKLEWVVQMLSTGAGMAFVGDPHLLRGFLRLARELGIRVPFRGILAEAREDQRDLFRDGLDEPTVFVDPRVGQMRAAFKRAVAERGIDLLIASSYALDDLLPNVAAFEFGFPSFHSHALTDQPFFGYRGCLSLVARLAERRSMHQLLRARRAGDG